MNTSIEGYDEAIRRVQANKSPRYHMLEERESWMLGTQYVGRPSWWKDDVPQWERAPCIVYPIVRLAASSNVDLMLGERAFPRFVFEQGADSEGEDSDIDQILSDMDRVSRFRTLARDAFMAAQGTGTACVVYGLRDDRPFGDLIPAKWCEPEFVPGSFDVQRLVIQYPYIDQVQRPDGTWEARAKIYRREITDTEDIAYKPADAPDESQVKQIKWARDSKRTKTHGFGFCPVVWYPFMRGCAAINVIDGKPIHQGLTDEIQAHDIARSQWHKTALYSDPQPVEIGVAAEHNPTGDLGTTANIPTTEHGGETHPKKNQVRGHFVTGKGEKARKKGPGHVWRYPDSETKVSYLTTPSDALVAQKDNVADLRIKLQEALAVVFLDPENIKFAATTSGKALEAIKAKQYDRVDQYREDFRDGFLLPSLQMRLRIAIKHLDTIKIPGAEALAKLDPESVEFSCSVQWGSYTAPDFEEQGKIVALVKTAKDAGLITLEMALGKLQDADVFDIEDITELAEKLAAEKEDREAKALEMAQKAPPPEPQAKT